MTILDFDRQYPPNFKNTRAIPDFIAFDDLKSERFRVNDFVIAQSYNAWNRTLGPARVGKIISIDIDSIHTTKEFTIVFVDGCTNEVAYDKYSIWNCDRITLYEGDTRALARIHADIPVIVKPIHNVKNPAGLLIMDGVEAFLFDVFGTVVDWRAAIIKELEQHATQVGIRSDNFDFKALADEWRMGYILSTRKIAGGAPGPLNVDVLHRELLDELLQSEKWSALGKLWDDAHRKQLTLAWHRLDAWPDSSEGLHTLRKTKIIAPLSNGNVRLLVDMAKYTDLPWDAIFSTELFGSFKPHPNTYLGAAYHLSLEPHQCAMVAAHIEDLKAAASHGMMTVVKVER
ncbi:hypothetical protein ONZ45_g16656 [Pleurotus djamor]|nr:hypothetical protein ONZ45_g16656 [Pleurotus djamor]